MRESRETHHLQIARTLGKANQLLRSSKANMLAKRMRDERGAVTAEYAVVIMGGVAFAGVLVAIMRSGEVRAFLLNLIEQALGSAG